jgi:3-ketosteroid 9alpha-monooxygenase subunit A
MAKTADYRLGEFTFPRGWFMIADAEELKDKPLPVRFFGNDFALYRGKSGKIVLLDAYCPHMGTHLAANNTSYVALDGSHIEGDNIRCPYHAWRFGPDGMCNEIPYYDRAIPKAACVRSWTVTERMGAIFAWYDPEGGQPDYEVPLLPEWDNPGWVRWKFDHLGTLNIHSQEILDNMADVHHLGPVHGSTVKYFQNEFKGHVYRQLQGGGHRTLADSDAMLETDTWYTGPSILLSRHRGIYDAFEIIAHAPIDDGVVKVWHGLLAKSPHEVATEADVAMARASQAAACAAFSQDFEVWSHKRPAFNVLQVLTEGPFDKGRIWYRQFYNPRARVEEFTRVVDGIHVVRGMDPAPSIAAE